MPPLTYLSNSAILRYLPFVKRQELSKKIPSFRVPNRSIPYRFKSVFIFIYSTDISLSLDSDISYTCVKGNINRTTGQNLVKYSNDDILAEDVGMRNKLLKKLLKYFLNRPGTSVHYLSIENLDDSEWCEQNEFNDIQLKLVYLDVSYQKMNKQSTMELFKNSQFSKIDFSVYELEDIDTIKRLESSRNAHCFISVFDIDGIDLQSLIVKLNESGLKYALELANSLFKNFLETLKTSRSYPLFPVKSTQLETELSESQLKDMGGVKSFVTKECKIQCYTFPTSDPQKEVIVTCKKFRNMHSFEAEVQLSGTSVQYADNIIN